MFLKDIDLYSKLDFIPIYSIDNHWTIAVYQLNSEIIVYVSEKYYNYRFVYFSRKDIQKLIYNNVYKEYKRCSSAQYMSSHSVLWILGIVLLLIVCMAPVFMLIMNLLYCIHILFKIYMTIISCQSAEEHDITLVEEALPIYTILVPIKDEKVSTIKSLIDSLGKLDYPQSKLDIKLIVEENDIDLVEGIGVNVDIIKVPYSFPQTKGKACNYALNFAKGNYLTIYDADDRPDTLQLKRALSIFQKDESIRCIQASLNYYNYEYNYLTKFFSLEYSNAFEFVLRGLNKYNFPILLGGSSNHFRINVLKECCGWDPYNVTEDAELGLRLHRAKHKVHVMSGCETLEESPITINAWIKQRARWIKGHVVTYIMHMKRPKALISEVVLLSFIVVQLLVPVPVLIYFFSPLLHLIIIFSGLGVNSFLLFNIILYFCSVSLLAFLSIQRRKSWSLLMYSLLVPMYNFLHPIACYRGIWQLITSPYRWDKTEHGMHDK